MPSPSLSNKARQITREAIDQRDESTRRDWLWLALIVVAGFIVRLLASHGDLWLDEIMSVNIARLMHSPMDILLSADAHKDNNHPLNTLWLWLVQSRDAFMFDRLLSVLAGTISIALAWIFARRWDRAPGFLAAIIIAGSFFMIHYGSEARGYALLVMFMLLAMIALDRCMQRFTWPGAITFWIACVLGMLSQLAFIHAFVALGTWIVWRIVARRDKTAKTFRTALICFTPPTLFIGWLFFVFIKGLQIAGANVAPHFSIIAGAAANTLGAPEDQLALASLVVIVLLLCGAMVLLVRRRDDSWVALFMLVIGAPAICMIVLHPPFLLARYFTVAITAMLLVISLLLGVLWQRGSTGRLTAGGLLAVFLIINSWNTAVLLKDGRGQYLQAMLDMAAHSPGKVITIGGDHDFRESTVINFYAPHLHDKTVVYIPNERLTEVKPQFVVFHSFDVVTNPAATDITDRAGGVYHLQAIYPSGPFSGWYWFVYQRVSG